MDKLGVAEKNQIGDTVRGSLSRRSFFCLLMSLPITAALAGVLTAIIGCQKPPSANAKIEKVRTRVGTLGDFPLNMGKLVVVRGRSIMVTNTQAAGLKAFSAICTHRGCVVGWNKGGGYILCPCHQGSYSPQTGTVISGPPPRPLRRYKLAILGEEVYISGRL